MSDKPKFSLLSLLQPRYLLQLTLWFGGAVLLYVAVTIIFFSGSAPQMPKSAPAKSQDTYLYGALAKFELNKTPRQRGLAQFEGEHGGVSLADFDGKIRVVNIWATYCGPCLVELPTLSQLQTDMPNIGVIAVAAEPTDWAKLEQFWGKLDVPALTLYQDKNLRFTMGMGGADVMPLTVIYDKKGNEVGRLYGDTNWNAPEVKNLLNAIQDGKRIRK